MSRRPTCRTPHATSAAVVLLVLVAAPRHAAAQQTVMDILSFLLTNRSVATGAPVQDEQAANATRDTFSHLLLSELATLPISSSSAGFTYRIEETAGGVPVRSSNSFGPFFLERSLTAGTLQVSLGGSYRDTSFGTIDGRDIRGGTLPAIASRLQGEPEPFDVETLSLRLRTRTFTATGNIGVTDRLDVSGATALVRLDLSGSRTDVLRGTPFVQANAAVTASGIGDSIVRAKYHLLRYGASGVAVALETRIPTGDSANLLGAGKAAYRPRVIGSLELNQLAVHGEAGYSFGGLSRELNYGAAVTVAAANRLTLVGEVLGKRLETMGRLTDVVTPHPNLIGVETIRLTTLQEPTQRLMAVGGVKWNPGATWLVSANVFRPLLSAGLSAGWVSAIAMEYSFGG